MENVIEMMKTDTFLFIIFGIVVILLIGFAIMLAKFSSLNKRYKEFMKKLGNGKDLEEDLETYMYRVDKVEQQNVEISNQIKNLGNDITKCIQKVGIVRYNAFKDTGSDLSFALAILDNRNNGVILNGIYSREMSNIYAKPIKNGISKYQLSEEEKTALEIAEQSKNFIAKHKK